METSFMKRFLVDTLLSLEYCFVAMGRVQQCMYASELLTLLYTLQNILHYFAMFFGIQRSYLNDRIDCAFVINGKHTSKNNIPANTLQF